MRFIFSAVLAVIMIVTAVSPSPANDERGKTGYQSPYAVSFPWPLEELIPDLLKGKRGEPGKEAKLSESLWYNHNYPWIGPWGPLPRAYKPPKIAEGKSDEWKRARVIATALRFLGYYYRHHYIPDWDPPPGWYTPKPGGTRHDGKGVDCSNFTSFSYNQALGIGFSSDIRKQAATQQARINGSSQTISVKVIPRQGSAAEWERVLKPGDLLFIKPRNGEDVSHVVIWIGEWGVPSGQSLILDSHGADVKDSSGKMIPAGIYLRPFRVNSWYAANAVHAIRIIGE